MEILLASPACRCICGRPRYVRPTASLASRHLRRTAGAVRTHLPRTQAVSPRRAGASRPKGGTGSGRCAARAGELRVAPLWGSPIRSAPGMLRDCPAARATLHPFSRNLPCQELLAFLTRARSIKDAGVLPGSRTWSRVCGSILEAKRRGLQRVVGPQSSCLPDPQATGPSPNRWQWLPDTGEQAIAHSLAVLLVSREFVPQGSIFQ